MITEGIIEKENELQGNAVTLNETSENLLLGSKEESAFESNSLITMQNIDITA